MVKLRIYKHALILALTAAGSTAWEWSSFFTRDTKNSKVRVKYLRLRKERLETCEIEPFTRESPLVTCALHRRRTLSSPHSVPFGCMLLNAHSPDLKFDFCAQRFFSLAGIVSESSPVLVIAFSV